MQAAMSKSITQKLIEKKKTQTGNSHFHSTFFFHRRTYWDWDERRNSKGKSKEKNEKR